MKLLLTFTDGSKWPVAPCVGAWIETWYNQHVNGSDAVAPCVGAWIETVEMVKRGDLFGVAPCVGAWIETTRRK